MPILGVATFVLLAIFFANGIVNVYLPGPQKPQHLFLTHESMFKALVALLGLAVGAILKYGVGLSAPQWEHAVFLACIVAGLGALALFVFNRSLIAKARANPAGRRGPRLADVVRRNLVWNAYIPFGALVIGVVGGFIASDPLLRMPLAVLGTGLVAFCAVAPSIVTKVASKYATDLQFGI